MTRTTKVWRVVLTATLALVLIGAGAVVAGNEMSKRPYRLRLTAEACSQLTAAAADYVKAHPGAHAAFPCTFTAYLMRVDAGGFATYGVSQNIVGECGLISGEAIDKQSLEIEWEAPTLRATPAACSQFASLHPRPGLWW